MRIVRTAAVVGCLIAGVGQALAQTPPPPGRGQRPGAPAQAQNLNQTMLDVQEIWNNMVLSRAKTALDLSETQYFAFFKQMQQLQQVRDRHLARRRQAINRLAQLTKPDVTTEEPAIAAQTKVVDDLETESFQAEQKAITEIDKILTVHQRARFRVFEERMEQLRLDLLARALNATGAPGPGGVPVSATTTVPGRIGRR